VEVFFDSWSAIGKTAVIGVLAYAALVATLRISGKRTLSKMSAFDLVVTVALGSTLSTIMLDSNVGTNARRTPQPSSELSLRRWSCP
jgi:purine-cytosine permease-like protein